MKKPALTIGICAHNEEANIKVLLLQILGYEPTKATIQEVLVVSSGSTDSTDAIVSDFCEHDSRIRLIRESERLGKVSAVNKILKQAKADSDIIIVSGADLQIREDTIDNLVSAFENKHVGMAGARIIPTNEPDSFSGFCSHLVWDLHHRIALRSPKCGEFIAIRNNGYSIPSDMAIDEAYLEYLVKKDGLSIAYAPESVVYNKGPESAGDYLKQRRRIHAQHMKLKESTGYAVSTSNPVLIAGALSNHLLKSPRSFVFGIGAIGLESLAVFLGSYDALIKKDDHKVWDVVESTKILKSTKKSKAKRVKA